MIIWEKSEDDYCFDAYDEHYMHGTFYERVGSVHFYMNTAAYTYIDLYDIEILCNHTFENIEDAKEWVEQSYVKARDLKNHIGEKIREIANG